MKMKRLFTLVLSLMMFTPRKKLVISTRLMLQSMQRVLWKQLIAPQMLQQEMF